MIKEELMKKRVLSLFLAFVLCLTLLPTSVFAEGADDSAAAGVQTEDNGQPANTGESEQPNSETDTRTEIWCVSKPDSIGRGYDGTTDGSTIPINLTFTDGTDTFTLKEGTGFTAKKTFDSADAGWHTVTVEIELIGDAAAKYKLKAGEETFTIGGNINKAHPKLNVSLSKTACTVGEKLLPLLSVSGAPKDAEVTYYYLASAFKSWAGSSDVEGSEAMPEIDENTAISEPGTYYVYAKTGKTKNYEEERSTTVELTVSKAVVKAASVTKADGTDGGTYESLPAALNAAQNGDTVNLLENHTTHWSDVEAGDEQMAVVRTKITLDLNGNTVDYLVVGEVVPDEAGGILESYDGDLTVKSSRSGSTAIAGQITTLRFVQGTLAVQDGVVIGSSSSDTGLICGADSGAVAISGGTVTISGGMVYNATVGKDAEVTVNGGSMHQGKWINNGKLNITGGTFGRVRFYNNSGTIAISGGTFASLQNLDNGSFQIAPISLLAPDHAFYDTYKENIVKDGSIEGDLQNVTVKEHTHTMVNGKCACGFSCTHTNAEGASTIGKDGKCTVCGTQFTAIIGETYYTDVPSALNAAADGQTVKLLANEMLPSNTYVSKTLTLDLNGHSLSGYSLNVGGLTATSQVRTGNLTVIDSSHGNGTVGVAVRDGGTLVFNPENDNTTLLQLEVYGGTVKLYGGKISRSGLRLNNGITLGNLLPGEAGLAYYCGDTQLTLAEAASKTCDLVVKSCDHGGKNGFDNSSTTCPYCGVAAVAETALSNGQWRRFADLQTAIDADRDGGSEFKLLTDVTGDYTIDGTQDTALDLNGHSIKGTVTVKGIKGDKITTTLSNTENTTTASIDKVVAYDGAELAGSKYPAVIGELTLAEGATWKTILSDDTALGYKVLNADGTHKWYAWDDVSGSQLNNVIINRLPITSKTLSFKVNGTNVKGNKVERGTTVQLCASCNAKDANVSIYIGEIDGNNEPKYSRNKAEYKKIGSTWYYVVDLDANTIGTYDIYFTATKDGYSVTSTSKKLTVTKPNLSNAEIEFPDGNVAAFNYATSTGVPTFIVTYKGTELKENVDFVITRGASFSGVGPCTLTIKATANGDYTGSKSAEWKVRPLKVEASVGDIIKTYDGTTNLPKDTKITFKSADTYYTGATLRLAKGTDYEVLNARYDSADAGQEKTVSFTIKLKNEGYVFEDDTKEKAFTLKGSETDKTFKIDKAAAPTNIPTGTLNVINGTQQTYTYDFKQLLPEALLGSCGTINYDLGYKQTAIKFTADGYYIDPESMELGNGVLTLVKLYAKDGAATGQIGTVKVKVTTTNYEDFQLTLVLNAINQIKPTSDGTISASEITYGDTLSKSKISGTMKDPNTDDEVKGTFAWTDGTIKPDANDSYEAEWRFTPDESYGGGYATVTGKTTVKVAPKSILGAAITLEKSSLEYNAAEQSPKITGVTLENWSENITYRIASGDKATDVNDNLTLTIEGTGNYTGNATVKWKITPREVTPAIEVASCTYTGDALKPTVTLKDGNKVIPTDEYTVEYSNNTNAGTGRVTIKDVAGGNYVIKEKTQDFPIDKATAPTNIQSGTLTITNGLHKTYSLDLSTLLPKLTAPCDYGTINYNKQVDTNLGVGSFITLVNGKTGELTLEADRSGTDEGKFGTITVTISTSNYQDITLTVNIFAKNKLTPVMEGKITASEITYGDTLSKSEISGKMKDSNTGDEVKGTFAWTDGTIKPTAGDYEAEWTFTPDSEEYATVTDTVTVEVNKARQYGEISMAGYSYGGTPSIPTLTKRTGDPNAQVLYEYSTADSGLVQIWNIQNPPALNAGTYHMFARIGETNNYYEYSAEYCVFVVAKATPTYTKPTGLTAKYGQTLADVTLSDGWSWMDSSESVGGASTAAKQFKAKFTPTDTDNYNVAENIELEVTVNKANQVDLTIQGADSVLYGQTLTLTASGGSGTGAVTYRVDTVNSTGEATIDPNTGVLTPVKVGSVSVIATKEGDKDYNDVTSAPFVLMIKPATPTGEPKYTKITTSGKTLADAQLTVGTITPAGTISWDAGDTQSVAANTAYNWTFKPTDTVNYNNLTGSITPYTVSHSGGGGGSYNPTYAVVVDKTKNGDITASPKAATKGTIVTLTIDPDKGYELDALEVLDKNGDRVKLTEKNGKYTFVMPASKVIVKGSFAAEAPEQIFFDVPVNAYYYNAVKWAADKGITGGVSPTLFAPDQPCTRAQIVTFLWRAAGSPAPKAMSAFVDVSADAYYAKAVAWAVENGITGGTGDGKFSPDATCTRAQAVTFLYRASGSPAVSGSAAFSDVATDAYYASAVKWAEKNGITGGIGNGLFGSGDNCTRGQIVTFLYRTYQGK